MDTNRVQEIKEKVLKVLIDQMVVKHSLPTNQGSLALEIQQLAVACDVSGEELTFALKEHFAPLAVSILARELMA